MKLKFKLHYKLSLLLLQIILLIVVPGSLYAQDVVSSNIVNEKIEIAKTSLEDTPQASTIVNAIVKTAPDLILANQNTQIAPGVCLVISNYLADFCRQYPADASCHFQ